MPQDAIAFIRDIDLFEQLDRELAERFQCRARFVGTADAVLDALKSQPVATLLIDSRVSECDMETQRLVESLLSGTIPAVNLITVGDDFLPHACAAALSLLAVDHIPLVRDQVDWASISPKLAMALGSSRARPIPPRRDIDAGGLRLCTYTSTFFSAIDDLLRVAHRDVTLLLVGETGTGKTTLAQFIHHRSPRRDRAFQHLACGALPGDLIESELFGHIRGAFTGAERNKIGRFQAAGCGTLLLDEIDVLDLKQQVKLLRVIETGEYELVGSTETRVSEARLIVASNVELEDLIEREEFRSDLYYRLNVLEFRIPPLRDRVLDIIPLAMQFTAESCREHEIRVDGVHREFLSTLKRYRWPGNLRELRNHMRRAVLFSNQHRLTVDDLSPKLRHSLDQENTVSGNLEAGGFSIAEHVAKSERELLEQALSAHDYNRTRTAEALGLSRVGLYKKLRRLGMAKEAQG